ncbi:MAG: FAD-dependent oxidoreductase [Acidobacteria bacterium]|nr:FAD-dependent oxidoreductase [Acidobacteriota bacterium]
MEKSNERIDEALGLNTSIPRRDFLNGALLSLGGLWAAHLSPVDIFAQAQRKKTPGIQPRWGGNTEDVFTVGHAVRDGAYDDPRIAAEETGEVFDLVIIGGGFSGLGAAYYFHRAKEGTGNVLVLENHQMVGGNARRDEFTIKGKTLYAPQASIVNQDQPPAFAPPPEVARIFQELKIDLEKIRIPPEASGFSVFWDQPASNGQARWYANVLEAPLPEAVRKEFLAFIGTVMPFYTKPDWRAELLRLDRYPFKEYVEREQKWTAGLWSLMQPDLATLFSFPDQVSAAVVYAQYGGGPRPLYFSPGGNSGFLRYLVKHLIPDAIGDGASTDEIVRGPVDLAALDRQSNPVRIRLGATAVRVEHEGTPDAARLVRVTYWCGGKLYRLRARGVIMAGGGYITQHIVRDLPPEKREAYGKFRYAPILQINVALNHSRALDKAGVNSFSTYHDGFGVVLYWYEKMSAAGWAPRRDPARPNAIGLGVPLLYPGLSPQEQAVRGRTEMLNTRFRVYERQTRAELARLLGPWGFDPKRDIAGIAISRWGHHGYTFAYPGIYTDGAVETAKTPFGRIAFAHTDLERFSLMLGAIGQGYRAVQDILQRI